MLACFLIQNNGYITVIKELLGLNTALGADRVKSGRAKCGNRKTGRVDILQLGQAVFSFRIGLRCGFIQKEIGHRRVQGEICS